MDGFPSESLLSCLFPVPPEAEGRSSQGPTALFLTQVPLFSISREIAAHSGGTLPEDEHLRGAKPPRVLTPARPFASAGSNLILRKLSFHGRSQGPHF